MVAEVNPYAPPTADSEPAGELDTSQLWRATQGQRFWAAFLDGLVTLPLTGLGMYLAKAMGINFVSDRLTYTLIIQLATLPLQIYQWSLIARTGQTLGKRWTRIKIIKMDGKPVDFVSGVVLRYWLFHFMFVGFSVFAPSASWIVSVTYMVDILLIFGAARRCLHDYIANTQVMAVPGGAV